MTTQFKIGSKYFDKVVMNYLRECDNLEMRSTVQEGMAEQCNACPSGSQAQNLAYN
jgi:hypothetical protein